MKNVILILLCVLAMTDITAQNTRRRIGNVARANVETEIEDCADTCNIVVPTESAMPLFDSSKIKISGYEKRASDYRETFFITNNTLYTISGVELKLNYSLTDGTQLHQYTKMIRVEIPAGETRKVDISGFDTQRQFYYYKSKAPRKGGKPYKVTIMVLRYDIIARSAE